MEGGYEQDRQNAALIKIYSPTAHILYILTTQAYIPAAFLVTFTLTADILIKPALVSENLSKTWSAAYDGVKSLARSDI